MKEEVMSKVMEKLLTYASNVEQFAGKEVPLYIKELLEYTLFESYLATAVVVFILVVVVAILIVGVTDWARELEIQEGLVLVGALGTVTMLIVAPTVLYDKVSDIYKVHKAPRVFVMDYIRMHK